MTLLVDDNDTLIATDEDLRVAVKKALARVGLSYEQLAEQARSGRFESEAARVTWVALCDLGEFS